MWVGVACAGFLLVVTAAGGIAQNHDTDDTFRSATNLVLVNVIATGRNVDQAPSILTRADFQVFDDGRPVTIRTFDHGVGSRPLSLWFVVQCNMPGWEAKGSGLFAGRIHLLGSALNTLKTKDRVAVAHWCDDGGSKIDLAPTKDYERALSAVEQALTPAGRIDSHARTGELALQKTLQMIVEATRQAPEQSIPVILFLYGDWSGMPKGEADRFVDSLLATSAIVFGIRDAASPQLREFAWLGGEQGAVANYLSDQTGGEYVRAAADQYGAALQRLLVDLHSRYELGFEPGTLDGKRHKLQVKLADANKAIRLRYRKGYVPK
jgi:hypothetical protein